MKHFQGLGIAVAKNSLPDNEDCFVSSFEESTKPAVFFFQIGGRGGCSIALTPGVKHDPANQDQQDYRGEYFQNFNIRIHLAQAPYRAVIGSSLLY